MNNNSQVRLSYFLFFLITLIIIVISVFNSPNYTPPTNTPSSTAAASATNFPYSTPTPNATQTPYSTPTPDVINTPYSTPTPRVTQTPNDQQAYQAAIHLIQNLFYDLYASHIAAFIPEEMIRGETKTVELILSPSLSEAELVARMVDQSRFINNPINQNFALVPNGNSVSITTGNVEITPRMMATLQSQDPEAFFITAMHDSDEQLVIFTDTTTWRWSLTAKKTGWYALELSLYQIIKYDGKEIPQYVRTIEAYVYVHDTFWSWLKFLDWEWIANFALGILGLLLTWLAWDNKKKNDLLKSLTFPLEIRAEFKGRLITAELLDTYGRTLWAGDEYFSPTVLAKLITNQHKSVNLKKFWKYKNPETTKWEYISTLKIN